MHEHLEHAGVSDAALNEMRFVPWACDGLAKFRTQLRQVAATGILECDPLEQARDSFIRVHLWHI